MSGIGFGSHALVELKAALNNTRLERTSLFVVNGALVISLGRTSFLFTTLLHHDVGKFSGIIICSRIMELRARARMMHPSLFFGNGEVGNGEGVRRELEGGVSSILLPIIIGESTGVIRCHPIIPEVDEVKVTERDGLDTVESLMLSEMVIEVDIVHDLANVDSALEVAVTALHLVVSG